MKDDKYAKEGGEVHASLILTRLEVQRTYPGDRFEALIDFKLANLRHSLLDEARRLGWIE